MSRAVGVQDVLQERLLKTCSSSLEQNRRIAYCFYPHDGPLLPLDPITEVAALDVQAVLLGSRFLSALPCVFWRFSPGQVKILSSASQCGAVVQLAPTPALGPCRDEAYLPQILRHVEDCVHESGCRCWTRKPMGLCGMLSREEHLLCIALATCGEAVASNAEVGWR